MIKTVRIENASKWRLCSRTERRPLVSPNPISTVQNEDQWVMNLSSKFQVDRPIDEARSDLWWNMGSEEKTKIFSLTSKMVILPFLSLFSYLRRLRKIGRRRRRRKRILFLILLYKGLRGLKFWALNLGIPHEEKPNSPTAPAIGIKVVLDTISDLKMFILNTIKVGFNVCFKWGIENCFTWETIWKWIGYWESYSLSLINKSISKNYVQLFNFILPLMFFK